MARPRLQPAVRLDTDLVGARKAAGGTYAAGPLAALAPGESRTRIW